MLMMTHSPWFDLFTAIAIYKPQDVRPILQTYYQKDIPIEYGKKEAETKQQFIEEWKKNGKSGGGFSISGLFGGSSQVSHPLIYISVYFFVFQSK